jgi:hypothetical protein
MKGLNMSDEPIHPMQAMIDGMGAAWMKQRSKTQLTLSGLIKQLESVDQGRKIVGLGEPMSYRGYYSDLAFATDGAEMTVAEALKMVRDCMGQMFEGYKGGDFPMSAMTPLWSANYGGSGPRIMGLNAEKDPITLTTAPEVHES